MTTTTTTTTTTDLPFLFQPIKIIETTNKVVQEQDNLHLDLLSFLSIARKFQVDFISITWQPALQSLGRGASSLVSQAQIDVLMYLAFKRLSDLDEQSASSTDLVERQQYRTLLSELIALEKLRAHPNVIDLLGITWETDKDTMHVRPVLLTERSRLGHLTEFLLSPQGQGLGAETKLELCCDVARACQAMHDLGIVHGDIKMENILIFEIAQDEIEGDEPELTFSSKRVYLAKVIDFGYSCLGFSEETQVRVPRTRPWQAPEHRIEAYVNLADARKMDVYSFGMLLCRVFLPKLIADLTQHETIAKAIDAIDAMKATSSFTEAVQSRLADDLELEPILKSKLQFLLPQILEPEPVARKCNFRRIVETLDPGTSHDHVADLDPLTLSQLAHEVLEIGDIIANVDDEDYLLKTQICRDLKRRLEGPQCPCHVAAAQNLGLCYEIGFGIPRSTTKARQYFALAKLNEADQAHLLHAIDEGYEPREPLRLQQKLGYGIALPFDPVQLYRSQGRLRAALASMEREADDRRQSFGEVTRPYLAQMSNLMLFLIDDGQLEKAAEVGRQTVKTCEQVYGPDDSQTINSYNYLAFVLFQCGFWDEVEKVQLELIPRKERSETLGPTNATTLNSHNYLVAIYCLQGRYEECLKVARKLVSIRRELIGKTHPETITTETWMCRALLEKGDMSDLEHTVSDLLGRSEETHGKGDLFTLQVKDILAAVILAKSLQDDGSLSDERISYALQLAADVVGQINSDNGSKDLEFATSDNDSRSDDESIEDAAEDTVKSDGALVDSRRLTELETILLLRSTATIVCALTLQGHLESAEVEIDLVRAQSNLQGLRTNIESMKLDEVISHFYRLKDLVSIPDQDHELQAVKKKLVHRWTADVSN